jgi:hypothetical protein
LLCRALMPVEAPFRVAHGDATPGCNGASQTRTRVTPRHGVLLAGHGRRAWAARWLVVAASVAAVGTAAEAHASAPAGAPAQDERRGQRAGFSFDLRLGAGVASVAYDESDRPIADFEAFAFGGAMRFGSFLSPHVLIGAELAASGGVGVGGLRVHEPSFFGDDGYPTRPTFGCFAPFGVFLEIYPWESEGLFFGATAGVGFMGLPRFDPAESKGGVMARYALELGYELGRTGKQGPAVYLRYHRWGGSELPFSEDHPDGLVSRELLVGLRWSIWTELWHRGQ